MHSRFDFIKLDMPIRFHLKLQIAQFCVVLMKIAGQYADLFAIHRPMNHESDDRFARESYRGYALMKAQSPRDFSTKLFSPERIFS